MLFTAYFDESNTSVAKPDLILAAFLGTSRQWMLLTRQIKRMQEEYEFDIFHATDFRARQGEFRDWSDAKAQNFINQFAAKIHTGLTEGLVTCLPYELFETEYLATPFPKGMRKDSQYGVTFRFCVHQFIKFICDDGRRHKLNIIIEEGQPKDVLSIFNELKAEYSRIGHDILGSISLGKKADVLPLMIADFQAHLGLLNERLTRKGQFGYEALVAAPPQRRRAGFTFMRFTPETLRGVKELWQLRKEQKTEEWRARRDARLTGL